MKETDQERGEPQTCKVRQLFSSFSGNEAGLFFRNNQGKLSR